MFIFHTSKEVKFVCIQVCIFVCKSSERKFKRYRTDFCHLPLREGEGQGMTVSGRGGPEGGRIQVFLASLTVILYLYIAYIIKKTKNRLSEGK